jgi:hypothetical protein
MSSLNIPSGKESEDLPYLYWIPKLHKTPCKERYIAGSSTCSTKELSMHLTKILSAVKEGQQKYCETVFSRSGINHMWILRNSKDLLDNLQSRSFSQVSSIKTFDFSTLYITLPHDKLKTRLKETIHKAFRGTIRTYWYADDLLKQCPSKGDKYVIDDELQHTDYLFLGVACFTFLNFV